MLQDSQKEFFITHLYPKEMSIYGDTGNIISLKYRLSKYGFDIVYQEVNPGQDLPAKTDFYFIGGGQDRQQFEIFKDLIYKKRRILEDIEKGIPLLSICGGFQLLGQKFVTGEGLEIEGIGLFDVETKARDKSIDSRCVGNLVEECLIPELAGVSLVGFENHSGQTTFTHNTRSKPLGKVIFGFGNTLKADYEGAVYKNAVGTYLHGSCLPKNPELADHLIFQAIRHKAEIGEINPQEYLDLRKLKIEDSIALKAKQVVLDRHKNENTH